MSLSPRLRGTGVAVLLPLILCVGLARALAQDAGQESRPEGDALPRLGKTGVLIPWEDFKKILDEIRGAHPAPTPAPPPVGYALTACQASVAVAPDETRALVKLELGVQVLARDGWVEVPVIADGVALSRFDLDGRAASAYRKNGAQHVALRGEGRHTVLLEYATAVGDNRGSRSTYLRFPQTPVINLDLAIPRPRLEVELPGAVVRAVERSAAQTRVRASYQQAADASVSWFKQPELGDKETKIFGELRTLLSIGEGMLRGTAIAAYTIHGRGVETLRIALPAGITVLDVEGQGMRDWSVKEGATTGSALAGGAAAGRVLVASLNYVAQGSYELRISFEQEIKQSPGSAAAGGEAVATIAAPDLALLDVLRDKGFVAVAAATNVEITPDGEIKNATPVDPAELPPDIAALAGQPVLYGFKYLAHPVTIGLRVVRHDDLAVKRTIVESERLYTYLSPEGHLITAARFSIRNNRKQYLELALPDGAEPWGAYLEGRPVKAARSAAGKVLVPLKKTATDAAGEPAPFELEVVYYQPRAAGFMWRRSFIAPALDVDAMEVEWHLFLPRDRRYGGFGGNLRPDEPLNRIVYLEGGSFNLASRDDRQQLARGNEERPLGVNAGADEDADQEDAKKDEADRRAPARRALARRDRLESELKEIGEKVASDNVPQSPPPLGAVGYLQANTQVSNVALDGYAGGALGGAGGMARGVLPVRFSIPTDGVRLSFSGRLLTAAERPRITLCGWPGAWTLSTSAVFLAALLMTVAIVGLGPARSGRGWAAARLAAALALVLLYAFNPETRAALWFGIAAAVVGVFGARLWSEWRAASSRAALGALIVLVAAGGTALIAPPATAAAAATADGARRELPDLHDTKVTLTWQDFKALVEKTYVPPPVEPDPPAEAVLRSSEYTGRLEPGVLTLDGALALDVLKKGWVRFPLTYAGTVVSFQGNGAILNRNGSNLEILARGPASYALKLTLAFPATGNPGENRLGVHLPDTPRTLLNVGAAPAFRDLQVEGGLAYGPRQGRIYVALPRGDFTLKYTLPFRRAEEKAGEEVKLEPRVQVVGYQLLRLGEGVASGVLVQDYNVRVSKVDHFDVDLPEGVVIFDATAPGLESWKILQRDGQRFLRVKLLAPAEGRVRVAVNFEGAYDIKAGRLPVPRFAPQAVERESGFVAVGADGAEVELELKGRLLPADVSEIPPDVVGYAGNLIAACKYSEAPEQATVKIVEHEDAPVLTAIIEALNATAVLLENGTEATWIDLSIKNNRKQFLGLTLPGEEVQIWSLLLDGQPAKPKQTGTTVLVPLPRGDGEVTSKVSLVLLRQGPEVRLLRRIEPRLPRFDVPVSEALWTVYLPEGKRYVVRGGPFRPVVQTSPLLAAAATGSYYGYAAGRAAPASPAIVPAAEPVQTEEGALEMKNALLDASTSQSVIKAQVDQEARVAQQLKQKTGARKGSLPVHIALPGGVAALPRVTVSRMLLVGRDDNTFTIRAYPAWLGGALAWLRPLLVIAAGVLLGLRLAGVAGRRLMVRGALPALLLSLLPLGPLGVPAVLLCIGLIAIATWAAAFLYRRVLARRIRA